MTQNYLNLSKLSYDLKNLFIKEKGIEFHDFQIILSETKELKKEKKIFNCHRAILASRSHYFKGLFRSKMQEYESGKVEFNDISPKIMEQILLFIYTGNIIISQENALELLIYSHKFLIPDEGLFYHLEEFILQNTTPQTAVQILNLALQFNLKSLYQLLFNYVINNFQEILENNTYLDLKGNEWKIILQRDDLIVQKESDLLNAFLKWIDSNDLQNSEYSDSQFEYSDKEYQYFQKLGVFPKNINQEMTEYYQLKKNITEKKEEKYLNLKMQLNQLKQKKIQQKSRIFKRRLSAFRKSSIIEKNKEFIQYLKEWINDTNFFNSMKIVFSGKKDGFSSHTFHEKCDNKGKTLVLIKTKDQYIFGGFSEVGWTKDMSKVSKKKDRYWYIKDDNSFLFTLSNPKNYPPKKFKVRENQESAICYEVFYGPVFGQLYADLRVNFPFKIARTNYFGDSYHLPEGFIPKSKEAKEFFTGTDISEIEEIELFCKKKD
ncbi:pep-cterm sorting domain-containing protein [Anaeramoeba ignava]|uniref:Pep-cterm sorting domain-containing protein n=1 Tax=Anaeramoeba ignava TaxID=1746090 RepID=A0A9Q0RCN1_ANAIG|nr:pep-cterm sorting domain-containing protein [Anaeramoeba ignava]